MILIATFSPRLLVGVGGPPFDLWPCGPWAHAPIHLTMVLVSNEHPIRPVTHKMGVLVDGVNNFANQQTDMAILGVVWCDNSVVFSVCLLYDDAMIPPQCYQCDSAIDGADVCSADDNSPATGNLKDCPPEENKGCYIVEGEDGQIKRVHLNDN